MKQISDKIEISLNDLLDILHEYDEDNYEATPLNSLSFAQNIYDKYQIKNQLNNISKFNV